MNCTALKNYEAIVFDLDGTLVDSAPVFKLILDQMRGERSLPPLPIEVYMAWSSLGASKLIANAQEIPESDTGTDLVRFRTAYEMLPTPVNCTYPGVTCFLEEAKSNGTKLGICTNKPNILTYKVLDETRLNKYFSGVVCGDTLSVKKPEPDPLFETLRILDIDSRNSLFIGDSYIDKKTAQSAEIDFLLFRSGYDLSLELTYDVPFFTSYEQLLKMFLKYE